MTSENYKLERKQRGTQMSVAALLGVTQVTIARRETGGEITREAWLALLSIPKLRKKKNFYLPTTKTGCRKIDSGH